MANYKRRATWIWAVIVVFVVVLFATALWSGLNTSEHLVESAEDAETDRIGAAEPPQG